MNDETGHSKTRGYINRNMCNGDTTGGFMWVVMQRVPLCFLSCRSLNLFSHALSKLLQHVERTVWSDEKTYQMRGKGYTMHKLTCINYDIDLNEVKL